MRNVKKNQKYRKYNYFIYLEEKMNFFTHVKIIYWNANGLMAKKDDLASFLHNYKWHWYCTNLENSLDQLYQSSKN